METKLFNDKLDRLYVLSKLNGYISGLEKMDDFVSTELDKAYDEKLRFLKENGDGANEEKKE